MPRLENSRKGFTKRKRDRSAHNVDWYMLLQLRAELCQEPHYHDVEVGQVSQKELSDCWIRVAQQHLDEFEAGQLNKKDKEFIGVRVEQTMREVDPQCSGAVDVDAWVHHLLLTRSHPNAMRATMQLDLLVDAALGQCPSALVGLQHALEVASQEVETTVSGEMQSSLMEFHTLADTVVRNLWRFWHADKRENSNCHAHSDFNNESPQDFVESLIQSFRLTASFKVTRADFLAVALGRREWPVTLNLYDLTKGAMSKISPWLLQEQVEGVWHSGVVVFGKEYYFGGDIYHDAPAQTGFGTPLQQVHLGNTLHQRDELHSHILMVLRYDFSRETYDAAWNNCNHFSDKLAMFLVGKHIPEDVLAQPMVMMQSGLGRALRPIVNLYLGTHFEPQSKTASRIGGRESSQSVACDKLPDVIKLGECSRDPPEYSPIVSL